MLLIQKLQEDGVLFEKEILSLLDKTFDKTSVGAHTQGSETATSYLKIGEMTTEANIQDFLKKQIEEDTLEALLKDVNLKFIEEINEEEKKTKNVYLKISGKRQGKVDVKGKGSSNVNISLETQDLSGGKLDKILKILSSASFSIKSYTSAKTIDLGKSNDQKAVSAIGEYVGTLYSRGAALYYLHHPIEGEDERIEPPQEETVKSMYTHYNHMKKVFELTGLGLNYGDLTNLNVDFLLVNRAREGDITCYSVKDLVSTMKNGQRYSFAAVRKSYSAIDW